MLLSVAALAVILHFRMVKNVPVAEVETDHGKMEMVVDTGANTTFFTGRAAMLFDRVCIENVACVQVHDVSDSVPAFRKLVRGEKTIIDGLIGNDVLSRFQEVSIDYGRKTISLGD